MMMIFAVMQKGEKMCDLMTFPDTVDEFMEQYKIVDTEHVYTNGAEFVPIFRMKQWFEHSAQPERMGKWIPCRLVLPAPEQRVICCTKTKKGTANIIVGYHDGDRWCCGMNNNVVAWMELPEPYEEGNR